MKQQIDKTQELENELNEFSLKYPRIAKLILEFKEQIRLKR